MCHENAHNNTVDVRFSLLTALFVFNGEIKGTFIVQWLKNRYTFFQNRIQNYNTSLHQINLKYIILNVLKTIEFSQLF